MRGQKGGIRFFHLRREGGIDAHTGGGTKKNKRQEKSARDRKRRLKGKKREYFFSIRVEQQNTRKS